LNCGSGRKAQTPVVRDLSVACSVFRSADAWTGTRRALRTNFPFRRSAFFLAISMLLHFIDFFGITTSFMFLIAPLVLMRFWP